MIALAFFFFAAAPPVDYATQIQPLFEKYCLSCHCTNATMGSLNLESFALLQKGGNNGPVVFPKDPANSLLYRSITGQAPEVGRMPMNNVLMAEAETQLIHDWIAQGALEKPIASTPAPSAAPPSRTYSLAISPDGKTVALGQYQKVLLQPGTTLPGHAGIVRSLAWSKQGTLLAAAGGLPGRSGEIKVWRADGELLKTFTGHKDAIYAVALSPDGRTLASASYDKLIKLWDLDSGQEIKTLKDHTDAVYALAFSPDGRYLLSGAADRTVKFWLVSSGERLFTLSDAADAIHTVAFSPDGQLLAAAGQDKFVRLWRLNTSTPTPSATPSATMIAHQDGILALRFTPDGRHLVTSSADRTLKVFRTSDLKEMLLLPGQPDWAYGLDVSPDGRRIAVGRLDASFAWLPLELKP